jgi:uridine monophosphate synthetase
MDLKASNLCLSADVNSTRELITLADRIGPYIVVLKTHHDVVTGWDHTPNTGTGARLAALGRKHGFLIFEDRKFGDIGNTVQMQYAGGTARIIDWAHIVNVNMVPGPATVSSLQEAAIRWKERYHYEVKTSVSVGTPKPGDFEDEDRGARAGAGSGSGADQEPNGDSGDSGDAPANANQLSVHGSDSDSNGQSTPYNGKDSRKGSIVSITTVTQHWELASSPRGSKTLFEGDEHVFPGIEEPPMERGLLILAQMSSQGNFMGAEYTKACVEVARQHKGFVMGFVSQQSLNSEADDSFIHMTPGCQLPPDGSASSHVEDDGKGQQYNTPKKLVDGAGVDVVIVGRGILKADDPQQEAQRYRREAWRAYLARVHDPSA